MFAKILHANDGSDHAFRALSLALAIAKQNRSDLHMVCVEEIPYLPEFVEEVREAAGTAARYFHGVLQRARSMAEQSQVQLHTHVLAGHPVRDIVKLASFQELVSDTEPLTEDSAALAFTDRYSDRLVFDHDVGKWFTWTGSRPNA